jgi:hypothetical protein
LDWSNNQNFRNLNPHPVTFTDENFVFHTSCRLFFPKCILGTGWTSGIAFLLVPPLCCKKKKCPVKMQFYLDNKVFKNSNLNMNWICCQWRHFVLLQTAAVQSFRRMKMSRTGWIKTDAALRHTKVTNNTRWFQSFVVLHLTQGLTFARRNTCTRKKKNPSGLVRLFPLPQGLLCTEKYAKTVDWVGFSSKPEDYFARRNTRKSSELWLCYSSLPEDYSAQEKNIHTTLWTRYSSSPKNYTLHGGICVSVTALDEKARERCRITVKHPLSFCQKFWISNSV